jgi:hypothetical protein
MYIGTGVDRGGSGILKSIDFGNSWSLVSSGPIDPISKQPAFLGNCIRSMFVDPTNDGGQTAQGKSLYCAVSKPKDFAPASSGDTALGVYQSRDGGAGLTHQNPPELLQRA